LGGGIKGKDHYLESDLEKETHKYIFEGKRKRKRISLQESNFKTSNPVFEKFLFFSL
jgi:hypothetical protein